MRYLALGDSYTVGVAVPDRERFPMQWAEALRIGHPGVEVDTLAEDGWSTGDLLGALRRRAPPARYDLCSLLIGVNNQYRRLEAEVFRRELAELLAYALASVGGRTDRAVVVSIPDWGCTPFLEHDRLRRTADVVTQEIDALNAAAREIARAAGVSFIDITDTSQQIGRAPELLASDGLHPSGTMYARWVEQLMSWTMQQPWFRRRSATSFQETRPHGLGQSGEAIDGRM